MYASTIHRMYGCGHGHYTHKIIYIYIKCTNKLNVCVYVLFCCCCCCSSTTFDGFFFFFFFFLLLLLVLFFVVIQLFHVAVFRQSLPDYIVAISPWYYIRARILIVHTYTLHVQYARYATKMKWYCSRCNLVSFFIISSPNLWCIYAVQCAAPSCRLPANIYYISYIRNTYTITYIARLVTASFYMYNNKQPFKTILQLFLIVIIIFIKMNMIFFYIILYTHNRCTLYFIYSLATLFVFSIWLHCIDAILSLVSEF